MIGSLRGLYILAGVAAVLLAVALLDVASAPGDRRIVDLDVATLTGIDGTSRGQRIHLALLGGATWHWRWVDPPGQAGDVDPDGLDRFLTALRAGHWHRSASASAAGELRAEWSLSTQQGTPTRLAVGQPVAGTDQAWIVVDDRARLVDSWIANALAPAPLALRIRRPLATAASATTIEITGPNLHPIFDGKPVLSRVLLAADVDLRLDPAISGRLAKAFSELELDGLLPGPLSVAANGVTITTSATVVEQLVPCSADHVGLAASTGGGCAPVAQWAAVVEAATALRAPPAELVEKRPAPDAKHVRLADGTEIDLVKIAVGFDPDKLAALAAALAAPAEIATGDAKPTGTITVDGTPITLYADGAIARVREPVRLLPGPAARELLRAGGEAFRDPRLWIEDASTIAAITVDGRTFARGATIGEWSGGDPKALEALAAALAVPTATGPAAPFAEHAHVVAISISSPAGGTGHELLLDAACHAMVDHRAVALPSALCGLVQRVASLPTRTP